MIYELLYSFRHDATWLRWLNVLRYVPFRVIASTIRHIAVCALRRAASGAPRLALR